MNQTASLHSLGSDLGDRPGLHVCRVQAVSEDSVLVAGPCGLVNAARAAGCLLAPQRGDTVLLMLSPECAYVLSVLERGEEETQAELRLPDQTRIGARHLGLEAGDSLSLAAPQASVRTGALHMAARTAVLSGSTLALSFERVRTMAGEIVERARRKLSLFGKLAEKISGVKETEALQVRLKTEETLRVRGRDADIRCRETVRVDGERIDIG